MSPRTAGLSATANHPHHHRHTRQPTRKENTL